MKRRVNIYIDENTLRKIDLIGKNRSKTIEEIVNSTLKNTGIFDTHSFIKSNFHTKINKK